MRSSKEAQRFHVHSVTRAARPSGVFPQFSIAMKSRETIARMSTGLFSKGEVKLLVGETGWSIPQRDICCQKCLRFEVFSAPIRGHLLEAGLF